MRSANIPTHVVMEIVGHSTARMTGQYTHATPDDLIAAARLMEDMYADA